MEEDDCYDESLNTNPSGSSISIIRLGCSDPEKELEKKEKKEEKEEKEEKQKQGKEPNKKEKQQKRKVQKEKKEQGKKGKKAQKKEKKKERKGEEQLEPLVEFFVANCPDLIDQKTQKAFLKENEPDPHFLENIEQVLSCQKFARKWLLKRRWGQLSTDPSLFKTRFADGIQKEALKNLYEIELTFTTSLEKHLSTCKVLENEILPFEEYSGIFGFFESFIGIHRLLCFEFKTVLLMNPKSISAFELVFKRMQSLVSSHKGLEIHLPRIKDYLKTCQLAYPKFSERIFKKKIQLDPFFNMNEILLRWLPCLSAIIRTLTPSNSCYNLLTALKRKSNTFSPRQVSSREQAREYQKTGVPSTSSPLGQLKSVAQFRNLPTFSKKSQSLRGRGEQKGRKTAWGIFQNAPEESDELPKKENKRGILKDSEDTEKKKPRHVGFPGETTKVRGKRRPRSDLIGANFSTVFSQNGDEKEVPHLDGLKMNKIFQSFAGNWIPSPPETKATEDSLVKPIISIFGLPLQDLKYEGKKEGAEVGGEMGYQEESVPIILRECVQYIIGKSENLETEGLFRVSPNYRQVEDLKALFVAPDTIVDLSFEQNVHNICGLLKLWLSSLPISLIPPFLHAPLKEVFQGSLEGTSKVEQISKILDGMGDWEKNVLGKLLLFLRLVSVSSEKNKMTSGNLGVVFGPTLMADASDNYLDMVNSISHELIEFLIDEAPKIWSF